MMQLAKKVPFEDPNVLMGVRALYILSNVIILGIYLYTQAKINAKKGMFFDRVRSCSFPPNYRANYCRTCPTFNICNEKFSRDTLTNCSLFAIQT
jgi:hypothetical protein